MAYCVKCGEKVEDTAVTCPACGAAIPGGATVHDHGYTYGNAEAYSGGQSTYHTYYSGQDKDGYFPESEVKNNKVMAVLCYIGVLVFVPVLAGDNQSEYLKLHKNQGLVLFIAEVFLNIVERHWGWSAGIFTWFTGGLVDVGVDIARFVILIFFVLGIVYACKGCQRELPGIGKIKLFK